MSKIPFYKPSIGAEEINEVADTLRSGWLTTGPKTKQFERDFAAYVQRKHAIAVNSCTAALHLALEAIGLKPGDGVIVPTMTFAATAEVVRYLGGRPILADCQTEDLNLDVVDAEQRIRSALGANQQVRAIMPVHYGGQVGDVAGVRLLARRYNLKVIEDAAHCCPAYYKDDETLEEGRVTPCAPAGVADRAGTPLPAAGPKTSCGAHGVTRPAGIDGKIQNGVLEAPTSDLRPLTSGNEWLPVGSASDVSCYSFYANKTITTGEGGMACTDNDDLADRMRIMSLHGISRDAWKRYSAEGSWYYEIVAPGYKYNLTDIAAAIGLHQLRKADQFRARRNELATRYREHLGEVDELRLPEVQPNRVHSWHLYAVRLRLDRLNLGRNEVIAELQQRGIGTSVHWMPLHMHPYYRETYGYAPDDLPTARALYPELISLPLYPDMSEADVAFVCDSIKDILRRNLRAATRLHVVETAESSGLPAHRLLTEDSRQQILPIIQTTS